jgi:hypothetical protein
MRVKWGLFAVGVARGLATGKIQRESKGNVKVIFL